MKKLSILIIALAVAFVYGCGATTSSVTTTAAPSSTTAGQPLKVLFLYAQAAEDGGWDSSWELARKKLETTFGSKVSISYKENVPSTAQATQVIDSAIQDGVGLVVGTSYGYGQYMIDAARKHPDTYFVQTQWESPGLENFSGFDYAGEDGYYLAGMAAGAAAKNGRAGMIDAFAIPSELRNMNGFTLGVRETNPDATVRAVITSSWYDPSKDVQAAKSLISSGVGALGSALNDPAIPRAAEQAGTPFVGGGINQGKYAPTVFLTGPEYDWTPFLQPAIQSILDNQWTSKFSYLGYKDGVVTLAKPGDAYRSLPASVRQQIDEARSKMKAGELSVFTGPIEDGAGNIVIPAGKTATVEQLQTMKFTVKGLLGVKAGG
ncbi:MAG: BMP family ABC transporter substrate-binding protein [Solirubrobacteraceae bacterium]